MNLYDQYLALVQMFFHRQDRQNAASSSKEKQRTEAFVLEDKNKRKVA